MITAVVLGTGNVATHLYTAFQQSPDVSILQLAGRDDKALAKFDEVETTSNFNQIKEADVCIIAASDDAVEEIADNLAGYQGLVVHTSGSTALSALKACQRRGVFYPLQTFSKDRQLNYREVPICLEAEDESDYKILEALADAFTDRSYRINSKERLSLHLAAVFVNNFSNHMYYLGQTICVEQQLPFDLLRPLIRETAEKVVDSSPYEAQTGPARRQDFNTLQSQLEQLTNERQKSIYKILSESIQSTYATKL